MGDQYDDLERMALSGAGGVRRPGPPSRGHVHQHAGAVPPIHLAQSQLIAHGFSPGHAPNGQLTAATRRAISAFQGKRGLPSSGTLDGPTRLALAADPTPSGMGPNAASSTSLRGGLIRVSKPKGWAPPAPSLRQNTVGAIAPGGALRTSIPWGGAGAPKRPVMAPTHVVLPTHAVLPPHLLGAPAPMGNGAGVLVWGAPPERGNGAAITTGGARPSMQRATAGIPAYEKRGQSMDPTYESAGKRVPIAFSSNGTVNAAAASDIIVTPQIAFRGETWVVDATTAANFSLRQIKIGVTPQNGGGTGDLPCTIFPGTQTAAVAFEMDLCNAGTQITVTVVNTDTAAHAFVGSLWGHEIRQAG